MNDSFEYRIGRASEAEIAVHLRACDDTFLPALSSRVDIGGYARKIADKAQRFEASVNGKLVGLVAAYCNMRDRGTAFITSVSVLPGFQRRGIASQLMENCITHVRMQGFARLELEVGGDNDDAIALYEKHGFTARNQSGVMLKMVFDFEKGLFMNRQRDYNVEIRDTADHQYAYSFDFDVMHPYMIRSFKPFFRPGNLLELGSFKGDFTRRFLDCFDDVTCVEASGEAIAEAKRKLSSKATYIHSLFESAVLPRRYDNIVLTHVLEHLDDPVLVLRRINNEWLAEGGRFFLVCPNANAPSRQIAVRMGLISHNSAITPAEAEHGHRYTYSLDTLERDAVAAGLKVLHRSGIFFKALANFQWDRLLQTDIISKEYLEGCYQLGQQYPDLCSSIFLLCERGENK
jgi:ribosomal protein S18 acetylase RimI-like enzyme/2-polyprenyl-3-methyl-5-hydroxy-6-metoxy-1,4-benzoquinol methylase